MIANKRKHSIKRTSGEELLANLQSSTSFPVEVAGNEYNRAVWGLFSQGLSQLDPFAQVGGLHCSRFYSNSAEIVYSPADLSHVTWSTLGLQQTWQSST